MFWTSAERNCKGLMCPPSCRRKPESGCWVYHVIENGQEENPVLNYLDSPQSRNTVRFNRLMLQGPDERASQVRLSPIRASLAKRRRHPEWRKTKPSPQTRRGGIHRCSCGPGWRAHNRTLLKLR